MAGQGLSLVGDRLSYLALVGVIAARTGNFGSAGSGGALSGLALALLVPFVVLSPWAASYLDRWRRRDVMVIADAARAVVSFALALMLPRLSIPAMLLFIGASSVANVFFLPARVAIVPDLVERGDLDRANGVAVLASVLATLFGTLMGAPLLARFGARAALTLDGLSYLASVATLLGVRRGPAAAGALRPFSFLPGAEAFRALLRSRRAFAATALLAITWLLGALFHVCGTMRLQQISPRVTDALAPALAAIGAGGAVGAVVLGPRLGRARSALAGAGLMAVGAGTWLFSWAPGLGWILPAAVIAGFASAPVYILADSELQLAVPPELRGGAAAARDFVCRGAFLVVVLSLGAAANRANAGWWLGMGAAFLGLTGTWYLGRRPLSN